MKIYFDMNIYNRIFDDQTQVRIRFESMATDILFELIEKGQYSLVSSFILDYENSRNPYIERKTYISSISSLCKEIVEPNNNVNLIAKAVIENSSASAKDALHLACAVYGKSDFFITCDDKLINTIKRNQNKLEGIIGDIKLYNPIDFLRKEIDVDVVE